MKKSLFAVLMTVLIVAVSCGQSGTKKTSSASETNVVNVYYFHGKQRCKTCIAVGNLAKQTIETAYAGNTNVKFTEIDTSDKNNKALVEKYEVSWNALIITKGNNSKDITEQAFANAIKKPEVLAELIKTEVNNRLN